VKLSPNSGFNPLFTNISYGCAETLKYVRPLLSCHPSELSKVGVTVAATSLVAYALVINILLLYPPI
jgi:hypothetical protein